MRIKICVHFPLETCRWNPEAESSSCGWCEDYFLETEGKDEDSKVKQVKVEAGRARRKVVEKCGGGISTRFCQ